MRAVYTVYCGFARRCRRMKYKEKRREEKRAENPLVFLADVSLSLSLSFLHSQLWIMRIRTQRAIRVHNADTAGRPRRKEREPVTFRSSLFSSFPSPLSFSRHGRHIAFNVITSESSSLIDIFIQKTADASFLFCCLSFALSRSLSLSLTPRPFHSPPVYLPLASTHCLCYSSESFAKRQALRTASPCLQIYF